jgi:hypothetical protein
MASMNQTGLLNKVRSIPGWFSDQDLFIFQIILKHQEVHKIHGNILEIGAYLGKSAVVLGAYKSKNEEVFICDVFQGLTDSENSQENDYSYSDLTRKSFERNYFKAHGELPKILECSSMKLWSEIPEEKFRFIHVDGSHLYDLVRNDLDFATNSLTVPGGVIVMDDFRAQHTLGVSKTLWESILSGKVFPLIFSASKVYLVPAGDITFNIEALQTELREGGYATESLNLFSNTSIRVLGLSDSDLYNRNSRLTWWVPPILLPWVKKIRSLISK